MLKQHRKRFPKLGKTPALRPLGRVQRQLDARMSFFEKLKYNPDDPNGGAKPEELQSHPGDDPWRGPAMLVSWGLPSLAKAP